MAYDEKFRKRAVEFKDKGHTFSQLKEVFGIDSKRYYLWKSNFEKTGKYTLKKPVLSRKRKIDKEELSEIISRNPDVFQSDLAEYFGCVQSSISKFMKNHGITNKKRPSPTPKKTKKSD
jgi:transposase